MGTSGRRSARRMPHWSAGRLKLSAARAFCSRWAVSTRRRRGSTLTCAAANGPPR
ncbi:hypothetical protein T492DRAFT_953306 [Pavlovales sp. CCMP2436]|nr:hypothetical protein T492DRAFT_953306 [Pavlovales sp. CCMP2436]